MTDRQKYIIKNILFPTLKTIYITINISQVHAADEFQNFKVKTSWPFKGESLLYIELFC